MPKVDQKNFDDLSRLGGRQFNVLSRRHSREGRRVSSASQQNGNDLLRWQRDTLAAHVAANPAISFLLGIGNGLYRGWVGIGGGACEFIQQALQSPYHMLPLHSTRM